MTLKPFAAASAAVLAFAGFHYGVAKKTTPAPFVDPARLATSICGGGAADAPLKRRMFFAHLGEAAAMEARAPTVAPQTAGAPPKVGAIAYEVTTSSPDAQAHFNAGLAHLWNFNHGAAIVAFKAAQTADPDCAMCYWAESFALGPNINAPMPDEAVAPAYQALRQAKAAKSASAKERALIDALSKRYASAPVKNRAPLDAAFADAMGKVAAQFPDDDFIQALSAEANMDTQPWDYWEADGRTPKGRAVKTLSLLEAVLARNPDHVAAIHLYIHITEATSDPYRAVRYADKLAGLSPGLGHLIHMPSHTYFRIGRYLGSLDLNVAAVAADEAFLAANKAEPMYEFGYYVHNIHFVLTSAQMAGDAKTALDMAKKLDAKLPADMAAEVPFAQPIKAAPYYAYAQFAEPKAVLELPAPTEDLPFLRAAWRYARGEALARLGDARGVRGEAEAISKLLAEEDFSPLLELNIPATDIAGVMRATLLARAAAVEKDWKSAVAAMEEAVATQERLSYTEPPYWYYPAKQTLAAMVLEAGDAERAEQLFIEALAESPNNGWVLFGVGEAYRRQGDRAAEKYARSLLKNAFAGDRASLTLSRL